MRRWLMVAGLVAMSGVGCFEYEDEADGADASTTPDVMAPDTSTSDASTPDAPSPDAGEPEDTFTGPEVLAPRAAPASIACAGIEALPRTYTPDGCGYPVNHYAGTESIFPHCGESSADAAPQRVRLTFPDAEASNHVAIGWETKATNRTSLVRIGSSPDQLDRYYWGHSFTHAKLAGRGETEGRVIHEVHLCDLLPGRTWYYQVGGGDVWSDVESFTTAPEHGSADEFTFAVAGDTRNEPSIWGQGLREIDARGAQFVVFSGDAVDQGPDQRQWDDWFDNATPWLSRRQFLMANGNHDLFSLSYTAAFANPGNEMNFHVRYGNALFISLNDDAISGLASGMGNFKVAGREYLRQVLETYRNDPTIQWRFLVNHRPFFSASTRHGSAQDLQDEWQPLLDEYGVDMVFNGHDHNYERSVPIRGKNPVQPGQGTVYVVCAGLGAPLYDNGSNWWTHKSEKVQSYAIVKIAGRSLQFTAYRLDGSQIDSFTWTK